MVYVSVLLPALLVAMITIVLIPIFKFAGMLKFFVLLLNENPVKAAPLIFTLIPAAVNTFSSFKVIV